MHTNITHGIFVWFLFSVVLNLSHLSSFKSQQQSPASAACTFTVTFPDSSPVPLDPPPTTGGPRPPAAGQSAHGSPAGAPGAPRLPRLTRAGGLGPWVLISFSERDRRARLDRRLGRKEAAPERGDLRTSPGGRRVGTGRRPGQQAVTAGERGRQRMTLQTQG